MGEVTVVVLTKSSKFSGYCVAGINYYSGKWVRLVIGDLSLHGAVRTENLIYKCGKECEVLDVIKAPIIGSANDILQPENIKMDTSERIQLIGKATMRDVLKIHPIEIREYIFGNKYPYIKDEKIGQLGYSLTLVRVNDLLIKQVSNPEGRPKTKADFTYQFERYENISVTDYRFYSIADGTLFKEAYLVVSIGTPYNNKYYKFISAIYVLIS